MRARRDETPARMHERRRNAWTTVSAGGSAPLATVVSLPTARAARPGAQRRDTPNPQSMQSWWSAKSVLALGLVVLARAEEQDVGGPGSDGTRAQRLVVPAAHV